ncbi:MAG: M28 family peptidase [Bacillota bacterium]|nr:M28 family peptidase [Bacillota bacterium]
MDNLLKQILDELDVKKSVEHIEWLTNNTPNRTSGMGQDRKAAEYICKKMSEYGLDTKLLEFDAYNSHPGFSILKVLSPETTILNSLPCCHIASTPKDGLKLELVYLGSGGVDDYIGKDVKGKAVLVEVSYAPATPEKAMLAAEHGALAMVCMNWGRDQDVICNRGLKAVWGNPTPETFDNIPQIAGVSIKRKDGEYLKNLCLSGTKVEIQLTVSSTRHWQTLTEPLGILRGSEEPEKFLLVSAHLDAWCPGVTCNATGDGTMLELTRVFGKFKNKIKRSIYFAYWNGHEIAEAAGSTWFEDYFWQDIDRNCIGYINIDSTGMKGAKSYGVDASRELSDFAHEIIKNTLDEDCNVNYLAKTGDQSFFGVGVPSIAGRISYSPEQVAYDNGATLGWWNHTVEDTLDKMDPDNLDKDNKVDAAVLLGLVNANVLPYDFTKTCQDMKDKVAMIKKESGNLIDIEMIENNIGKLAENVSKMNVLKVKAEKGELSAEKVKKLNQTLLRLSRLITNSFYTSAGKYDQDSYGRTILSKPIPLLYELISLSKMDKESLEYKLLYTKLLRNRNRVSDAVNMSNDYVEMFLNMK